MKHDAIYARYSSHAQDDGTSIEVQIEQCERAAGGKCHHYIDRAKTGRAMGGRAQMLAMLADAEAGKIKRVFVYKFDRLGRAADTHLIAQQLEDAGIELISATEGTNQLARGIQLVVAEDYSRQLANRTRDGLMKRFEQGGFTGGMAPYGYHVVERDGRKVLEVDSAEAAIVREVARMYLEESAGFKTIAKRMRARSIASRRGKGWSFTSVRCLLVNTMLTGRIRFNVRKMHLDRATGRRLPRRKVQSEVIERREESLRILDDETFAKIQKQIGKAARGQSARTGNGISAFTGLVFCAHCGNRCYRVKSKNAKGSFTYYVCARHLRYGDCEQSARIREDALANFVRGGFEHVLPRAEEIIARVTEAAAKAVRGNRDEADRLKREIAATEADQDRLIELLMDRNVSDVTKQAINRKSAAIDAKRSELQVALDGLRENSNETTDRLAEVVRKVFDRARRSLSDTASPEQFNRFIEQVVGPMLLSRDGAITQKALPATEAAGSTRYIAGGGFEPPTSGL